MPVASSAHSSIASLPSDATIGLATIPQLSPYERSQLGRDKFLQSGKMAQAPYLPEKVWPAFRHFLVAAQQRKNPALREDLTAFTPGETVELLNQPHIREWRSNVQHAQLPSHDELGRPIQAVIFIPCAKTKPWDESRVGIYRAVNEARRLRREGKFPPYYFVTVSEPLGVIPESSWGDFPSYENPGLFADDVLRTGLFTRDWKKIAGQFGLPQRRYSLPFDPASYETAVSQLSGTIEGFLKNQTVFQGRLPEIFAFVETSGRYASHRDIMKKVRSALPDLRIQILPKLPPRKPDEALRTLIELGKRESGGT